MFKFEFFFGFFLISLHGTKFINGPVSTFDGGPGRGGGGDKEGESNARALARSLCLSLLAEVVGAQEKHDATVHSTSVLSVYF